jgi:hypothetical protein
MIGRREEKQNQNKRGREEKRGERAGYQITGRGKTKANN